MTKPRLIIVIRHAQSEGNKNKEIHQTIPDHRVKLTPEGKLQALEAGRRLRNLLRPDDTLHFFTSPYRRTRETTEGILETLTSDEDEPSPFRRSNIKVYEEPRLREQDFGNFQPCSDEMERMWQERADYGHFFYRIPNGESAADAYDRVSGFNESLWRQFGEDGFASVCVLVTHGLMSRVFLMKWYHFSVEYFEDLRNVNHCEFLIMRKQDNGKYHLENNLRTWSQLRRERALKDGAAAAAAAAASGSTQQHGAPLRQRTFIPQRRWGGCPNGCDHSRHYEPRKDLEVLRQKDVEIAVTSVGSPTSGHRRPRLPPRTISSDDDDDERGVVNTSSTSITTTTTTTLSSKPMTPSGIDLARAKASNIEEPLSSPEILLRHPRHLHVGRDGGGTYSGHTSAAGSDTDEVSEDDHRRRQAAPRTRGRTASALRRQTAVAVNDDDADESSANDQYNRLPPRANRLGDAPPEDSTTDAEVDPDLPEDIDKAEKEDKSILGSVY